MRLGHEATRLQKQRKEIENSNKNLSLELDRLTALASVEARATSLGFERTDPRMVVMVERQSSAEASSQTPPPSGRDALEGGRQ